MSSLQFTDHIKYAGMFLETSYFDRIYDVDIYNLAGYEERTRVLYMIPNFYVVFGDKIICDDSFSFLRLTYEVVKGKV